MEVKGVDLDSFERLLIYLYSDSCDEFLSKLKPDEIIHLLTAARRFEVERLIWILENHIKNLLSLDTIVPLLLEVAKCKELRIKKFCTDYILMPEIWKDFVVKKDLTSALGMDLFSELVSLNATQMASGGGGGSLSSGLGSMPPSTARQEFRNLFGDKNYKDAFVKIGGDRIEFHKHVVICASQRIFKAFSKQKFAAGNMDDCTEAFELHAKGKFYEKISKESFEGFLKYAYWGETDIPALSGCLLIPFTRFFGIKTLQESCEKIIQDNVSDSKAVLKILSVTYLSVLKNRPEMREKLKSECIAQVMSHLKQVNMNDIRSMDSSFSLTLAVDLLLAVQKTFG